MMFKNTTLPEQIDFNNFTYPKTPNYFLLTPSGMFDLITQPESPVFDCSVEQLEAVWKKMIAKQSRVKLRSFSEKKHRYHYLCRTLIFRFPDYLIVQFFPVDEKRSTLLMYSYSIWGRSDFSANKMRVFKYLIALKKALDKEEVG